MTPTPPQSIEVELLVIALHVCCCCCRTTSHHSTTPLPPPPSPNELDFAPRSRSVELCLDHARPHHDGGGRAGYPSPRRPNARAKRGHVADTRLTPAERKTALGMLSYDAKFGSLGREEEEEERRTREEDARRTREAAEAVRKSSARAAARERDDGSDSSDEEGLSPLFWTKPPSERRRKPATKEELAVEEMLTKMVYEDRSPAVLADEFKQRGNDAFRQGQLKEALSLYSEAMHWNKQAEPTETFDPVALTALIYCNRAAVSLKLGNLRTALKEAKISLKMGEQFPSVEKAKFRAAKACIGLRRPRDALAYLADARFDTNAEATKLREEASQLQRRVEADIRAEERKLYEKRKADDALRKLYASRPGLKVGPLTMDLLPYTGGSEQVGERGPAPTPSVAVPGTLVWPVLFMYPEHAQSDFVQAMEETTSFEELLSTMFPPGAPAPAPWDKGDDARVGPAYRVPELEVYFRERAVEAFDLSKPLEPQALKMRKAQAEKDEGVVAPTASDFEEKKWVRVKLARTLGEALAHPLCVVPGIPVFCVVSRVSSEARREFLKACARDGPVVEF